MQDFPRFDLDSFTAYRLAVASQKISEEFSQVYRTQFGLSTPEWRILAHLTQADGASVRDIEAKVVMEKSKASRAAARFEKNGLIEKFVNASDRRLVSLKLTPKGRALLSELLPQAEVFQRQIETKIGINFTNFEQALDILLGDKK